MQGIPVIEDNIISGDINGLDLEKEMSLELEQLTLYQYINLQL